MGVLASLMPGAKALARKPFIRNVVKVASGTAVAQAITIAFYPVITRLYGPEAFGILGLFMSVVAVLTPVAGLAYPIAIVLPKSDRDARGLARLSLMIAILTSAVVALMLVAFSERIVAFFGLEQIAPFILLLPFVILFATMLATAQQWSIRTGQFTLTASVAVLQAFIVNMAKVGLGFVQPLASSLIVVSTVGVAVHAAMLTTGNRWRRARREDPFPDESQKGLVELARVYRDFPFFRAPQELLNALSHGLPLILLAGFYGAAVTGFYVLAYSVLTAPITLIGASVGNVLYPRLAEAANRGEDLRRLVLLPTGALFVLGLVPFGTIMLTGPSLFAFVFGEEWREAGEYARWLSLWLALGFTNIPSVKAVPVINEQKRFILFGITSVFLRVISVLYAYYLGFSPISAVIFISISGSILNISLIIAVSYRVRHFRSWSVE